MVLKPYFLRGFKTIFFHRKTQGPGLKPYEKIGFSAKKPKNKWKINKNTKKKQFYHQDSNAFRGLGLNMALKALGPS